MSTEELQAASRAISRLVRKAGPAGALLVDLMGDIAHELLTRAVGDEEIARRLARRRDHPTPN